MSANLQRRVLSALVLGPAVLLLVYVGGMPFAALVALAAVLMAMEWARLTGGADDRIVAAASALVVVGALVLGQTGAVAPALATLAVGTVAVGALATLWRRPLFWPVVGTLWIGLPCLALIWLRARSDGGLALLVGLLLVVWACDSAAYFTGRALGGPRLAPVWSPNKTWSGLVGGCLASALVAALWGSVSELLPVLSAALAGGLLALISQLGDVSESAVKRRFGVKDSGDLIPGHGGLLDRVDGLLFAAPTAAVLVWLWERGGP